MIPLQNLIIVFSILFIAGFCLSFPLYKFNLHKFIHSSLFIKILFWVPIFIAVIGVLYANNFLKLVIVALLIEACFVEFARITWNAKNKTIPIIFFAMIALGLAHFVPLETFYQEQFIGLVITIAAATVLADVFAFLLGNYIGKHKLPAEINPNKSWEGVFGEIIGALAGIWLVNVFIEPVLSMWLFIPIGLGSILGDLSNSYVKRRLGIKDWSGAIPGHGGFIDRFCSLAGSVLLTFYFLLITGLS